MKSRIFFTIAFLIVSLVVSPVFGTDEYVYIKKGDMAEKEGNFQFALEQYNKALEINPKKDWLYLTIGKIYREKIGDYELAIENYKNGLEYFHSNFDIYQALMHTYFGIGRLEEGMDTYEQLARINVDNKKFSLTRQVLEKLKNRMSETDLFELSNKYLSLNPTDFILREFVANYLFKEKEYHKAINNYESMMKYSSNRGPILFSLALCYYNLQDYNEAIEYFKKAESEGEYVPKRYYEIITEKNR